jgi:NAD(P)-dependent dehydrogenase (short-subunit alcohol dehydrogenase family)
MSKRVVLITGVSRGMGKKLVEWMVASDAVGRVIAVGRESLAFSRFEEEMKEEGKFLFFRVDVREGREVEKMAEELIKAGIIPDLLINNAAILGPTVSVAEISPEAFKDVLETNVLGVHNVMRCFIPVMKNVEGAVIVNISSGWGRSVNAGFGAYCTSKWALEGLTLTAAKEMEAEKLAIVSLAPGIIQTDMLRSAGLESAGIDLDRWIETFPYLVLSLTKKDNGMQLSFKQ